MKNFKYCLVSIIFIFVFIFVPSLFYWLFLGKSNTNFIQGIVYQNSSSNSVVDDKKIEDGIVKGTVKKKVVKKVTKKIVKKIPKKVVIPKVKKGALKDKEDPGEKNKKNKATKPKDITIKEAIKKYKENNNKVALGIDISKYQGEVDFKQVKDSGVEFVIIRVGYRGTETGVIKEDPYFKKYIEGAISAGLKVGVYFFSVAITEEEALEEAAWTISRVSNYKLSYPIAFDFETFKDRASNLTNGERTNNALTFMSYIEQHGYQSMMYTNINSYKNRFIPSQFFGYKTWIAHYIEKTDYKTSYSQFYMWQYASDGRVPGIKGRVDMDIAYQPV